VHVSRHGKRVRRHRGGADAGVASGHSVAFPKPPGRMSEKSTWSRRLFENLMFFINKIRFSYVAERCWSGFRSCCECARVRGFLGQNRPQIGIFGLKKASFRGFCHRNVLFWPLTQAHSNTDSRTHRSAFNPKAVRPLPNPHPGRQVRSIHGSVGGDRCVGGGAGIVFD